MPAPTSKTRAPSACLAAGIGQPVRILCVSEVVEDEEEMISYLHDRNLTPGTVLTRIDEPEHPGSASGAEPAAVQGEADRYALGERCNSWSWRHA